jgi:hypothetical protein
MTPEQLDEIEARARDATAPEFLAHARSDVPALAAEVRRLESELLCARSALQIAEGRVEGMAETLGKTRGKG